MESLMYASFNTFFPFKILRAKKKVFQYFPTFYLFIIINISKGKKMVVLIFK